MVTYQAGEKLAARFNRLPRVGNAESTEPVGYPGANVIMDGSFDSYHDAVQYLRSNMSGTGDVAEWMNMTSAGDSRIHIAVRLGKDSVGSGEYRGSAPDSDFDFS